MRDGVLTDDNGKYTAVVEMKTTKNGDDRFEDVPEAYALQASLYAYLLGVDDVMFMCTVLQEQYYLNVGKIVLSDISFCPI